MNVKTLVQAMISSGLIAASAAQAGSLVDVEVLARPGYRAALPSYWFQGQNYVEGRQNQEFRVRLHNKSAERVLAVLSVDGVNAISGETAGLNQAGYVLAPYQTLDVDGWRKSNAQTAAFYFTHINDSYAARTGRPDNVGVIGAAVFREIRYDYEAPQYDEYSRDDRYSPNDGYARDKSAAAPSVRAAPSANRDGLARSESKSYGQAEAAGAPLGTGHGRQEYRPSVNVAFEREPSVFEVLNVRYDSRANLIAQGVIPQRGYYRPSVPQAFPNGGFVPDPDYSMSAPYRGYQR
jgi:hypothetical protein